jgi:hypothetical protein
MGVRERTSTEHRYQTCRDEFCDRFPCRIYQEGRRDGQQEGYQQGWSEGYTEGVTNCPLTHQ